MALNLYVAKRYDVVYCPTGVSGWSDIGEFIKFLEDYRKDHDCDIWISEDEADVEIDFYTLDELVKDEKWGTLAQFIKDYGDKRNDTARLAIF